MFRRTLGLIFLWLWTITVSAQYYQYSQYNYAQQRVNPGAISLSDYATAGFIYRSQKSVSDVKLNSFLFSAKYPIIAKNGGKRWSSIGVSLGEDKSGLGGIFETNEIGLTYALNFPTGKRKMLSVGGKLNYQSKKVNSENLFTGSQFIEGQGFVKEVDPGEDLSVFNTNFISASAGVIWQQENRFGQKQAHFGASLFDINQPNESFLEGGSSLPATFVLEGGYRIYDNNTISIYPELLYTLSRFTSALSFGAVTTYQLDRFNSSLQGQHIELHTKYLLHEGIMVGVQWKKRNLSLGTSYDIPINNRVAHRGAFEIGMELGKLVKSRNKSKNIRKRKIKLKRKKLSKRRKKKAKNRKKKIEQPKKLLASNDISIKEIIEKEGTIENKMEVDTDRTTNFEGIASVGEIRHEPFEFEQTKLVYNFDFDSHDPKHEAEQYITDLIEILQKDEYVKIEITGHTDNVGNTEYNQRLSIKRAKVFFDLLVENKIDKNRITYTGKGEQEPLNSNETPKQRYDNRRVEIVFYY